MGKETSLKIFRFLAGFISVYHLTLGLIGTFGSASLILFAVNRIYGAVPEVDVQFLVLARFISVYFIVFAVAMGLLAWKPLKYRNFVWLPIVLFSVRIIERIVTFDLISEAFGTTMGRNLQIIVPIGLLLVLLFVFRPKNNEATQTA